MQKMQMRSWKKKTKIIVGASVLILAGTTTSALAAIPDSDDGEFHMCIPSGGSAFKSPFIIDKQAGTSCSSLPGYTEKTWKSGTPGPAGPAGPAGPQGEQGEQGPQGEPGEDGADAASPHVKVVNNLVSVGGNSPGTRSAAAVCPEEWVAVSGGFHWQEGTHPTDVRVERNTVNPDTTSPYDDRSREYAIRYEALPEDPGADNTVSGEMFVRVVCMNNVTSDGVVSQ